MGEKEKQTSVCERERERERESTKSSRKGQESGGKVIVRIICRHVEDIYLSSANTSPA